LTFEGRRFPRRPFFARRFADAPLNAW